MLFIARLKSCPYCGKIHKGECKDKPKKQYNNYHTKQSKFRKSVEWTRARKQVLERDNYCCQICLQQGVINASKSHHVHHIIPLANDWDLRTEQSNLICLCEYHHSQTHNGVYNTIDLQQLVNNK